MKYEQIKFSQLIPSDYNPRVMSQEEQKKLSDNLEKFGLVDPIIINLKNNHIIGGHQRYSVLKGKYGGDVDFTDPNLNIIKLGDIGWVFENENLKIKDENHEKALNLALNKISGEWDYGKLSDVLDDLNKVHFNMDLTGFDSFEIDQFVIPKISIPEINDKDESFETASVDNSDDFDEEGYYNEEDYNDDVDEIDISDIEVQKENASFICPKCGYQW